jgi:hypothetical protein
LNDIKETQKMMEDQFEQSLRGDHGGVGKATKNLKAATHALNRTIKQNPLGNDIFQKIEMERSQIKLNYF